MITVEHYDPRQSGEWDAFIAGARNATLLHRRAFFNHNPANALDDASLLFRKRGSVVGALPASLVAGAQGPVLVSHARATYGGFVVGPDVGIEESMQMVQLAIDDARASGAVEVIVRNPFRIFHLAPSDETDYAMWRFGFRIRSRELEVAIPLAALDPSLILESFESKARNQTRKALREGVEVAESDDFEGFWRILEENLTNRHGTRPTHTLAEILRLRELLGAENVLLFAARREGELLAGAVVLRASARAVHTQYIASRHDRAALCPVNALILALVAWAKAGGYAYLNLGMSTESGGTVVNTGLFRFKESFGGRSVLRETMALSLAAGADATSGDRE